MVQVLGKFMNIRHLDPLGVLDTAFREHGGFSSLLRDCTGVSGLREDAGGPKEFPKRGNSRSSDVFWVNVVQSFVSRVLRHIVA